MKRILRSKKASHVGVVLSFVVFVTFLIYLISILQPTIQTAQSKEDLLNSLRQNLIQETEKKLTTITYEINETENYDCLSIQIPDEHLNKNFTVTNTDSIIKNSKVSNNQIIFPWNQTENFVIIKFINSSINPASESSCVNTSTNNNLEIKSIKSEFYITETEIENLILEYNQNYQNTKSKLFVSSEDEFSFDFEYENTTIVSTSEKNTNKDIFSERMPIQYLNRETNINFGFLQIKIW